MRIVLIGGGGHASDVLGVIEDLNEAGAAITVAGILDDGEVDHRRFDGRGVKQIGRLADLANVDASHFVLAIGWPSTRRQVADRLDPGGRLPATLVSPLAGTQAGTTVGAGTVIMGRATLSAMCRIGEHVCISQAAVIGHDCVIGDFAGIMPAAVVSGDVEIGEGALIGTNATVRQGLELGAWTTLGAGSVLLQDLHEGTAVGIPARHH